MANTKSKFSTKTKVEDWLQYFQELNRRASKNGWPALPFWDVQEVATVIFRATDQKDEEYATKTAVQLFHMPYDS
jgi:hypothetical protein